MISRLSIKSIKYLLLVILAAALIILPIELRQVKASADKTIDIIEITDFHGALFDAQNNPIAAVLAKRIKDIKKTNPRGTLIIGGGDNYAGTPISRVYKGVPVQKIFNSIGMEVTALGNHEFDWPLDTLNNITMKGADYSIVCANARRQDDGKLLYPPSKIIKKNGIRIAIVGAITKHTPSLEENEYVNNIEFTDPAEEINKEVKRIRYNHLADIVIAVIHEGDIPEIGMRSLTNIVDKLQGVNVVLGGHTHNIIETTSSNGIPVEIGGFGGNGFIDLKLIYHANKSITFSNTKSAYVELNNKGDINGFNTKNPKQDKKVKNIVEKYQSDFAANNYK